MSGTGGAAPDREAGAGAPASSIFGRVQGGLERAYRIDTGLDVRAFLIDESERDRSLEPGGRRAREQILLANQDGELAIGLFVDEVAVANLERHDPVGGLSEDNFGDFCLVVEGVSHFIYVALCAERDRRVTALELELQAEVDKFVACALMGGDAEPDTGVLRQRLYHHAALAPGLDGEEHDRYQTANAEACRYAAALDARYIRPRRVPDMLADLRRFYRLPLPDKLGHIARAAA